MAELFLDADKFGTFYISGGNNGEDDHIHVRIGEGFRGTIAVDSSNNDMEIESVTYELPAGWTLDLINQTSDNTEDPPWQSNQYNILDEDGNLIGTMLIRTNFISPICFARGMKILCADGEQREIETLSVGDMISTRDHGPQPIRWIGSRRIALRSLGRSQLRPILIREGALGAGLPDRDLQVSPQHRLLVRSRIAKRMFGESDVLVAAKYLTALDGISENDSAEAVEYFHLLFDHHEVIFAEGAPAESLLVGPEVLRLVAPEARQEICEIYPQLVGQGFLEVNEAVALLVPGRLARSLARRHAKNKKPLLQKLYPQVAYSLSRLVQ